MATLFTQEVVFTEAHFRQISQLVYDHCGINLHDGKKELIRTRLTKKMRMSGFTSFEDYMEYVRKDESGRAFSDFIDALSTNLTSFFRERQHFSYLQDQLLPQLIERKQKGNSTRIRVWSAGCSSGEEPYSIAMTLHANLKGHWDVKVLATDISTRVLETARTGVYSPERVEPVLPQQRSKYLITRADKGRNVFEVHRDLKEMILFKYLNLMGDWPVKGPLDFIFCRNVMIYFDKPTQAVLVNRFYDLLGSGGVFFTGHSESLTGIEHRFKYIQPTIYMKP